MFAPGSVKLDFLKIFMSVSQLIDCFGFQILLSNDTNLRNKSIVEDLETYSVKEFEKNIMNISGEDNIKEMAQSLLEFRAMTVVKSVLQQVSFIQLLATSEKLSFKPLKDNLKMQRIFFLCALVDEE